MERRGKTLLLCMTHNIVLCTGTVIYMYMYIQVFIGFIGAYTVYVHVYTCTVTVVYTSLYMCIYMYIIHCTCTMKVYIARIQNLQDT